MRTVGQRQIKIDDCREDAENANRMDPAMLATLGAAIERYGFQQPALVRVFADGSYRIIDGHHRIRAARSLGWDAVPAIVVECDDNEARVLQLGMNRLRGEVDLTAAAKQIAELFDAGWSMPDVLLSGFSADEVDTLLRATETRQGDPMNTEMLGTTLQPEEPQEQDRVWTLDLAFRSRADLAVVKKRLRKAAGKHGDLADGLLRLLETEER